MTTITLTTVGAGNWTVPADCTSIDELVLVGAGGSGRGNRTLAQGYGAGGGEERRITGGMPVTPGASIPYVIGAGGPPTTASTGTDGGDTTWNSATFIAKGGQGGQSGGPGSGGTGGTGGVGSAGQVGNGAQPAYGGAAGGTGNGAQQTTAGADGNTPGGGSAGGVNAGSANVNPSGTGARGEIRITYTPVTVVTLSSNVAETFSVTSAMTVGAVIGSTVAETFGVASVLSVSAPTSSGSKAIGSGDKISRMFRHTKAGISKAIGRRGY